MVILGKDGKEYTSVKECLRADEEFDRKVAEETARKEAERKAAELALAEKKATISKRKKELSTAIETATEEVKLARVDYNKAKEDAEKIMAEARLAAQKLLDTAGKALKEANEKKVKAVAAFNKEFGPFSTILTGEDAWNEYKRVSDSLDSQFNVLKHLFDWL